MLYMYISTNPTFCGVELHPEFFKSPDKYKNKKGLTNIKKEGSPDVGGEIRFLASDKSVWGKKCWHSGPGVSTCTDPTKPNAVSHS